MHPRYLEVVTVGLAFLVVFYHRSGGEEQGMWVGDQKDTNITPLTVLDINLSVLVSFTFEKLTESKIWIDMKGGGDRTTRESRR